jgi:AraC-like DNA-binding protein
MTTEATARPEASHRAAGRRLGGRRHPAFELLVALRRARDVADRDFAQPLDLGALAQVANLSKFHFARAFADAYGETPRAYITRRRIERAKDMLRAANLTITEICMLVGFESLGSFSSRFHELVGASPSEYRRRVSAAGGPPPIPGCFVMMWTRPTPHVSAVGEAQGRVGRRRDRDGRPCSG